MKFKRFVFLFAFMSLVQVFYGFSIFGSGLDGSLSVSDSLVINTNNTILTQSAFSGQNAIIVQDASIFTINDNLLIIQMLGGDVGVFDDAYIVSIDTSQLTITLDRQLANSYVTDSLSIVQVIRIPNYTTLNILQSGTITCNEWNGSTGGVIALKVLLDMENNGMISATGKGFHGSPGGIGGFGGAGGSGGTSSNRNGLYGEWGGLGGAGGSSTSCVGERGGNGGMYGLDGSLGSESTNAFNPGFSSNVTIPASNASDSLHLIMGSGGKGGYGGSGGRGGGGGGAATNSYWYNDNFWTTTVNGDNGGNGGNGGIGGNGGVGGGIIYLNIQNIHGYGNISSNGSDGYIADSGNPGIFGGTGASGNYSVMGGVSFNHGGGGGGNGSSGGNGGNGGNGGAGGLVHIYCKTSYLEPEVFGGSDGLAGAGGFGSEGGLGGACGLALANAQPGSPGNPGMDGSIGDNGVGGYAGFQIIKNLLTVSGSVKVHNGPLQNVSLRVASDSYLTSAEGMFSSYVPTGFSGAIIPEKQGWRFIPEQYQLTDLYEDMGSVVFSAVPTDGPYIDVYPDTLRFGNVATLATATKPVTLYNLGSEDLEVYSITSTSSRYSVSLTQGYDYPLTLAPSDSLTIWVNFSPLLVQSYDANLVLVSNDPNSSAIVMSLEGYGYLLEANFEGDPVDGIIPMTVQFSDQSQGDIISRLWEFGDGETSSEVNPSHTYHQKGIYDVSLTIIDQYTTRSLTRDEYINVSAHPVISTPDSISIDFGVVYLGDTGTHQLMLESVGTDSVFVYSIAFYHPNTAYSIDPDIIPEYILPGTQAILDLDFYPYQASTYNDTLYVYNSSENNPILTIQLRGIGEYVPPQTPQGVTIVIDGYDAVISWEAVTQNIYNTPITVPYYFIYGSLIPNPGPTEQIFIGYSTGTTFHHAGVNLPGSNVQPPPQYFYTVTAVVWYPPRNINIALDDLIGRTKEEVERQLR